MTVGNGEIYLGWPANNLVLHNAVTMKRDLDVVYAESVYFVFESHCIIGSYENPEELRIALEMIDNSNWCYLLSISENSTKVGLLEVNGVYYKITLSQKLGDVVSTVSVLKEKN